MSKRIVITATGILTSLGRGAEAQAVAVAAVKPGLRHPQLLRTIHAKEFLVGEVPMSNEQLGATLSIPKNTTGLTRTALLAMVALGDLIHSSAAGTLLRQPSTAFINANTVGGMSSVEDLYTIFAGDEMEGDFIPYIDTLDCAESTERAAAYFGLKAFVATISTACSSSGNALHLGARLIRMGLVDRAICGGCDALSRFTVNGFNSLKNLDRHACRPFDNERNGLNLGEGAAYLLLEKEEDAIARGAHILAVFSGSSNSNDAYHPTAPSPDGTGAIRAMQQALRAAKLKPQQIDYINAHGTATIANDAAEGKAIETLFGAKALFSSTKPFTGHTLAAAAAVEAIISINALNEGLIPANLNFQKQMDEMSITPVTAALHLPNLQHVISNSFGFGGNNVSLVFSKP